MPTPRHADKPLVQAACKLTLEEKDAMKIAADSSGLTVSQFMRKAIQHQLERRN